MSDDQWTPDLVLGAGHTLIWTEWLPDLDLNPQYRDVPSLQTHEHYGAIIRHPAGPHVKPWATDFCGEGICEGGVVFDTATARAMHAISAIGGTAVWTVQSWDPLTISPSILCECGDHGFIRGGEWIPA
jgi:hypothetical protein